MKFFLYSFLLSFCLLKTDKKCFEGSGVKATATVYKDTAVINFFRRNTGCIAGDGGFSVPLSNHKVCWLMGDSHINDYDAANATVPCLFQVRNTALLQPVNDWNKNNTQTLTGKTAGLKSFLKNNPDDHFFCWPGAGIQLKDTLYIYCSSLKNQGTGAFGFAASGNDFLAKINLPEMNISGYCALPAFNGISFGTGFIKEEQNKWVYVYGQKYIASKIECDLYVARFPVSQPGGKWQFWNGRSWDKQAVNATIIARQTGVSGTFHISKVKQKFLLLSSRLSINCDSGTEIYVATADKCCGPFTTKKIIWSIDDRLQGHSPFFYAAIAHPEYINNKDELLVTYAINGYGSCVPDCKNNRMDPDVYRLRAIRVPCKLFIH